MKTLLFDIDGTLLLTHHSGSGALKRAMEDEFELKNADIDLDFGGRTDRSILAELLAKNRVEVSPENIARLRERYVELLPGVLIEHGGTVLPGVQTLLDQLSGLSHFHSYVMTGNLVQTARMKLDHFCLGDYFHDIFGGDHDEHRNDLARRTAQRLHDHHGPVATQDVFVIGDTVADIECGHAIGARVIAVATGSHEKERLAAAQPLAVVDDLSDATKILEILTT